jgi:arylsulfatase A-like enzyme
MEKAQQGTTNTQSVFAAFDLAPSLLRLAGFSASKDARLDGEDLSATLLGNNTASRQAPLFWRRPPDRKTAYGSGPLPDLAVREGDWKLLCDFGGSRPELYQLRTDPGEANNLAQKHPEIVQRLSQSLLAWNASMPPDNGEKLGAEEDKPIQKAPKKAVK